MNSSTHENDFYAWTQEEAHLLKTGQIYQIDLQNIAEEIKDMGRSEKGQLESRLEILIMHLLKWQFFVVTLRETRRSELKPIHQLHHQV